MLCCSIYHLFRVRCTSSFLFFRRDPSLPCYKIKIFDVQVASFGLTSVGDKLDDVLADGVSHTFGYFLL